MKNRFINFAQGIRDREVMDGFTVTGESLGRFLLKGGTMGKDQNNRTELSGAILDEVNKLNGLAALFDRDDKLSLESDEVLGIATIITSISGELCEILFQVKKNGL